MFDTEDTRPVYTVAFTCVSCNRAFSRAVRAAPELVRRCLACDRAHIREVSDRLLDQLRPGPFQRFVEQSDGQVEPRPEGD